MVRAIILCRAAPGVSREEFRAFWNGPHFEALKATPVARRGLVKAVHNLVVPQAVREDAEVHGEAWSGIGCYSFEDEPTAIAFLQQPEMAAIDAAAAPVIAKSSGMVHNEVLLYDAPPGMALPVKMFAFFIGKPNFTRPAISAYYRGTHAEVGASINKGRTKRYIQNHASFQYHNPDAEYDYDGGPEIWFDSMEVASDLFNDQEGMSILAADEEKFVIRSKLIHFFTDEELLFQRAA